MLPKTPVSSRKRGLSLLSEAASLTGGGSHEKEVRSLKRKRVRTEKLLNATGPILRSNKAIFSRGNYDCYYQFRNCQSAEIDPRLLSLVHSKVVENLFEGKSVMDIGCNTGFVAFQIAALFGAKKVIGIDIDPTLITSAVRQIRKFKTSGLHIIHPKKHRYGRTDEELPNSLTRTRGPTPYISKPWMIPEDFRSPNIPPDTPLSTRFPFNLEFRAKDVLNLEISSVDIVLAFSVTKWVHLNGGDEAVKKLFFQVRRFLNPGGLFLLEAEAWKGYKLKKNTTREIRRNYDQIRFRPLQFGDYLVETLGFSRGPVIQPHRPIRGFDRPIQVFIA